MHARPFSIIGRGMGQQGNCFTSCELRLNNIAVVLNLWIFEDIIIILDRRVPDEMLIEPCAPGSCRVGFQRLLNQRGYLFALGPAIFFSHFRQF